MQTSQLEHLIRAAAELKNEDEFVVVGSQSIVGALDAPPPECLRSMEAAIYPMRAPELADLLDGPIGELAPFHEHCGYYAQGVSPTTAVLPPGWQSRLVRLQSQGTNGRIADCLDPPAVQVHHCEPAVERTDVLPIASIRLYAVASPES